MDHRPVAVDDDDHLNHLDLYLEHLPAPCLYLSRSHKIVFANAAARHVVAPLSNSLAVDVHSGLVDTSIFDTNFVTAHLTDEFDLKLVLDELEACEDAIRHQTKDDQTKVNHIVSRAVERDGSSARIHQENTSVQKGEDGMLGGAEANIRPRTIFLPGRPCEDNKHGVEWDLSSCPIHGRLHFCLMGHPPRPRQSWKNLTLSKEEEYDFFRLLAAPTFSNPQHTVNLISADMQSVTINERGRAKLTEFASQVEKKDMVKNNWGLWNDDFTTPLPFSEGAGPTSLKAGHGMISVLRGAEHPVTGMRTIIDATTTNLNNPFTGKALGTIVQARDGHEWSTYLQRLDIEARTTSASLGDEKYCPKVRTMLLNGQLDYFSTTWEQFSGYTRAELCSGAWLDCIHPLDAAKLREFKVSNSAESKSLELEVRFRKKAGSPYRYHSDRIVPLRNEDGTITRWYCISTDIHDSVVKRRKADRAVERFYNIISSMNITLFSIGKDYRVRKAEGTMQVAAASGENYDRNDYVGHSLKDLCASMRPDGVPELFNALSNVMEGKESRTIVDYNVGGKQLRTIAVPEINEDDTSSGDSVISGVLGLTWDLSAEYAHERAKNELESLREADRLKSEFLANVSHELRTPIAAQLGLVELLLETNIDGIQIEYIQTLQSSVRALLGIVNNILDLSKMEANAVSIESLPFDLPQLLEDVIKTNEVLTRKKGLELIREPFTLPYHVLGDSGKIRQILYNLVTNAIKFTAAGFIKMNATYREHEGTVHVIITIEDSGIGIDDTTMKRLFKPFVQADQSTTRLYGGSGLGLTIARKLAQAMGGDVILESDKGKGTRAVVTLQLGIVFSTPPSPVDVLQAISLSGDAQTDKPNARVSRNAQVPQPLHDRHVLLVEDNEVNRRVVMAQLQKLGFSHIHAVENGAKAVAYVAAALTHGPNVASDAHEKKAQRLHTMAAVVPKIVLMDCQMPVLDGYDATRQLRSLVHYNGPIVALTASAIQGDRQKCLDAGMDDYLTKPYSREQLRQTLEKWMMGDDHDET